jgi:hypothetical protein
LALVLEAGGAAIFIAQDDLARKVRELLDGDGPP